MYRIEHYVDVNTRGTAVLLQVLTERPSSSVRKLVVASSMSIYGEGKYDCLEHGSVYPRLRPKSQLEQQDWEMHCPICERTVVPQPTDEDKPLHPTSVYAISKRDQEELCLTSGWAYGMPSVALRYFNVYGPRQALSNPYTGTAAIFAGRLLNGQAPMVFEDGRQSRDLTYVGDIVQANLLAMDRDEMNYRAFNVGTGQALTILEMAQTLIPLLDSEQEPEIVPRFRAGDTRHCYADIGRIRAMGYEPQTTFQEGIVEWIEWVRSQTASDTPFERAQAELIQRGLTVQGQRR
jgi:dTDP-L-rhamnose 4-epimerase